MTDNINRLQDYAASPAVVMARALPGGAQAVGDWLQSLILRGFGWHATVGTLTTPITGGGAGTVLDLDQPEFVIDVPQGYVVIPVRMTVQIQIGLQTTDAHENEILIAADLTQDFDGTGTFTAETPMNMRTDIAGSTCPCTIGSAFTADTTDPVLSHELARKQAVTDVQTAVGVNVYQMDLLYEPSRPPIIVGPAMIVGYWGGDIALPGFAQLQFIAMPSNLFTSLG